MFFDSDVLGLRHLSIPETQNVMCDKMYDIDDGYIFINVYRNLVALLVDVLFNA